MRTNADMDLLHSINSNYVSDDFNRSPCGFCPTVNFYRNGTIGRLGVHALAHDDEKKETTRIIYRRIVCHQRLITYAINYGVNRQRPYEAYPEKIILRSKKETYLSFVSRRTSAPFNFASSLALAFPKRCVAVPAYTWALPWPIRACV